MAARTRARVFALTLAWWLRTRDTVWWETPASAATWFRVGARDRMSAPCGALRCGWAAVPVSGATMRPAREVLGCRTSSAPLRTAASADLPTFGRRRVASVRWSWLLFL